MSDPFVGQTRMVRLVFWVFDHHPVKFLVDWHTRAWASRWDAMFDGPGDGRVIKLRDVLPGPEYSFSTDFGPFTDANLRTLLAKWPSGRAPRKSWAEVDAELRASSATPQQLTPQTSGSPCQFPESSAHAESLSAGSIGPVAQPLQSEPRPGVCE